MLYTFAQCVGFLGTAILFVSYQMPVKKNILLMQIISASVFSVHYLLLGSFTGSYTGMVMNIIGVFRTLLFYFEDKKWFKRYAFTAFFLAVIIYIGIDSWKNIFSLFPILGMVDSTICLNIKKEKWFRICNFPGSPLWLIYGIYSHSYSGIIGEIITMTSIIIAIIRYDVLKQDKKRGSGKLIGGRKTQA